MARVDAWCAVTPTSFRIGHASSRASHQSETRAGERARTVGAKQVERSGTRPPYIGRAYVASSLRREATHGTAGGASVGVALLDPRGAGLWVLMELSVAGVRVWT